MVDQGNIRPEVELNATGGKPFVGLEGVFDGVEVQMTLIPVL